MARSPLEIFAHHAESLIAGNIDEIVADYSDDALFITPDGVLRGKAGVRKGFEALLNDLPDAEWSVPTQHFEGTVGFIEWKAVSATTEASDGIDTFVFDDEHIVAQTVRYTLQKRS
ncbi:hypothetical protein PSU4_26630 [Pseudonocardia sulfidoxydans NBRC 16205]|uniref:SnoaL-like domain-containing protein n=1 Tax=Pseudonocardia sulfidoxydans NBRC 16205 TaxID=1223511 RepID=A0A511DFZ3_9PSEU|nr:nuclear transport factor 2 family protein [Pseudonocardia sulfidoxydans]GEL23709.1 hypothetical protein PSU4_26630 [Pseudonocardia sulfidoxydans NBRC 16205]